MNDLFLVQFAPALLQRSTTSGIL